MFSRRLDRVACATIRALSAAACLVAGIGFAPPAVAQEAAKPSTAQTAEQLEQQYGREAMAQALDAKRRYDLYGVHFETGQAAIQPQSQALLDDIADVMKSFPTWRLEIVGHTDAAGDPAQNEALSRARADAVRAALVHRGIAEGRLVPEGMGETQPVASNDTPEGRALNRRVELVRLEPQPNILVIWGDDIGWYNISAYNLGVMGYQTPNIDRIAREGALFTDWYGQQSCTAGRAAFATGQSPVRTGLTKVGLPGAPEGLTSSDPTIADLLKPLGYATGQFGKNHLGDRNEHLPTVHGFDEFFGNLYHLNAEEEPENIDYPTNPEFKDNFGPRGVLHCYAIALEEAGEDPRFGAWGKQKCEDTGPLTAERMETVDREFLAAAAGFIDKAHQASQPFFVWYNTTRMHIWTHLAPEAEGKTGIGVYPDGMVEHDAMVGELLAKLDQLGIADDTIVMYATDNGAEVMSWPDGGTTPFRGEKNTNWEGGYRVPSLIRWPGVIEPGTIHNEVFAHEDMLPTLLAAAGDPDVVAELAAGKRVGDQAYKVHLDGYNLMPFLKGEVAEAPRKEFLYWTDGGRLAALRYDQWKLNFLEQRAHGFDVWEEPFVELRLPKLFTLRGDPFERADHEGMGYPRWRIDRAFMLVPAQVYVSKWLQSFAQFPPRMKAASFGIDEVMRKITEGRGSN